MSARNPKWHRRRHKHLYLLFLRLTKQGYHITEIIEAVNAMEYKRRKDDA